MILDTLAVPVAQMAILEPIQIKHSKSSRKQLALKLMEKYGSALKAKLVALHNAKAAGTGNSASKTPTYTVGKIYTTAVDNLEFGRAQVQDYSAKKWQDLTKNAREHAYTSGELKRNRSFLS